MCINVPLVLFLNPQNGHLYRHSRPIGGTLLSFLLAFRRPFLNGLLGAVDEAGGA